MRHSTVREFGKRNPPRRTAPAAPPPHLNFEIPEEQQAALAQIRLDMGDALPAAPREVPRSFRAAILAGLVTGFFLTGLDLGQPAAASPMLQPLLASAGLDGLAGAAQPYVILFSLLGGARAAASALLFSHSLLATAKQTSLFAYALSAAAINTLIAGLIQAIAGAPPPHGWPAELAAGALAGFFYRVFAGAKIASRQDPPPALSPARH